jgi:hypothetical protein
MPLLGILGDGFGFAVGWADWFTNCSAVLAGAIGLLVGLVAGGRVRA